MARSSAAVFRSAPMAARQGRVVSRRRRGGGAGELMELVAPAGPVYQAGTLSANPLAMCAGLATLQRLEDGRLYPRLEDLRARLQHLLSGMPGLALQRVGSIFWICRSASGFAARPMRALQHLPPDADKCFAPLFHSL